MEKKEIIVNAITTDRGKIYINSEEIGRKLTEGLYKKESLYKEVYPENNISYFNGMYYGEYADAPEEFEEYKTSLLQKITECIENGTFIIKRRKGRGSKR